MLLLEFDEVAPLLSLRELVAALQNVQAAELTS